MHIFKKKSSEISEKDESSKNEFLKNSNLEKSGDDTLEIDNNLKSNNEIKEDLTETQESEFIDTSLEDNSNEKPGKHIGKDIFWVIAYVVVIIALAISGSFLFVKNYYSICWVDGQSMYPTFNSCGSISSNPKGIYDLTLFDEKNSGRNSLKRFDIVTTYYNSDYIGSSLNPSASKKIKRLIGFPNEEVWITYDKEKFDPADPNTIDYYILIKGKDDKDYTKYKLPFDNSLSYTPEVLIDRKITLGDKEYAVKGDNWGGYQKKESYNINWYSYDSFTGAGAVKDYYICGKYIAYVGTCGINAQNPHYTFPRFYYA